jgi:hypothetical protein
MRKRVVLREDETVESIWPATVSGTIIIAKAASGWYRCLIIDPPLGQMGYDGDGLTPSEAYYIAVRQWERGSIEHANTNCHSKNQQKHGH